MVSTATRHGSSHRATSHRDSSAPECALPVLATFDPKRLWRASAPARVRDAWKRGDGEAFQEAWAQVHAKVKRPRTDDLVWGLPTADAERVLAWQKSVLDDPNAAAIWLDDLPDRDADILLGLEALFWARAAPYLTRVLAADLWWRLAEALASLAEEAAGPAAPQAEDAQPTIVAQLLAGELPLVLSRTLADIRPLHELGGPSHTALSDGLERLTDGEGLLSGALWVDRQTPTAASLLIACWTRCRTVVVDGKPPWTRDAQLQFEWLVRQTLRIADRHGRVGIAPAEAFGAEDLLKAALKLAGDESDSAAATLRLKRFKGDTDFEPPAPSNHSEWAEMGVLAAGWRDKAPRIVVAHPADTMRVQIAADKRTLLAGDWPVEASIDGKPVTPADGWDCQCWYTDDDCDYLELALPLAGGARLERQFFLAREDGVGFISEVLFSNSKKSQPLAITSRIPLGEGVSLRPEKPTREAHLTVDGEPVAGLAPLALPEWREDPRGGELTADGRRLLLTREWTGRNAASPLWFDFSARRFAKQRTWRQLTVAESLKSVTPDVAIAYRVQAAKQQWLIYRSLDKWGNRTVLGQNYSSEQIVGRFQPPEGTVHEYFEIEAGEE